MRIVVMGAGALGGYFGARLARAGHEVVFVARGRQLEAMRTRGLRVESPLGDVHLPEVTVTGDPAGIGAVDLVLFSVKLPDTQKAAEAVKPLLGDDTAVVSFQNGVVKDDILRRTLGAGHLIGGLGYIAATLVEPGLIRHTGTLARLVFGEYDGSLSPRVRRFLHACAGAAIEAEASDQIERAIWEKFVFLVGLSGTTSLARTAIGPVRDHPRSRAFLHDLMDEVVQVARMQGVPLPVGYAADRLAFIDTLPATMTSSMHHDLDRGNRLEVAWLSGDVTERGARLGVATPCNRAVFDILSVHSDGRGMTR
ncbi:MAG: ketopantoate reductase family protein [Actinobacteria bacterium]|nr:ketopantoate reductase family protein [Actinomycetota bacterium]